MAKLQDLVIGNDVFRQGEFGQAIFSADAQYRYALAIPVNPWLDSMCLFDLLNPSKATHIKGDPTVTRCIKWTQIWGFGYTVILNAFALRSTDPKALYDATDPIGPHNNEYLNALLREPTRLICGWGNHGTFMDRGDAVLAKVRESGNTPYCFGVTQTGQPKHPLARGRAHIPYDTELVAL